MTETFGAVLKSMRRRAYLSGAASAMDLRGNTAARYRDLPSFSGSDRDAMVHDLRTVLEDARAVRTALR